jgi:hypothetical protein
MRFHNYIDKKVTSFTYTLDFCIGRQKQTSVTQTTRVWVLNSIIKLHLGIYAVLDER